MILDIIIPIYNKEKQIINYYNKINEELKNIKHNFIFIDNCSTDKSLEILENLYSNDENHIKIISLSKQYDKETSIYAGIKNSKHELVCIYDTDLQASISHISKMYEFINENKQYDQICMYSNYELTGIKKLKTKYFNKLFKMNFDINKTFFRIMKRNVVDAIIEYSKYTKFSIYTFEEIGFNTYYSKFESKNVNNYSLKKLLPYVNCPFKFIKMINYTLLLITFILLVLSIFKLFLINNNILLVILILLLVLNNSLNTFCNNYLLKKDKLTIYGIRKKIGFEENIL